MVHEGEEPTLHIFYFNQMTSDKVARERILELKARPTKSSDHLPTIFDTALKPDADKGQIKPTIDELAADTLLLLIAGTDSTAHALTFATYNVLQDPNILRKLQAELRNAMPRKDMLLEWAELEKLPYLRGIIKETLRASSGAPGRLPRVVPSAGAVFCGQRIAPGVSACSTNSPQVLLRLTDCALSDHNLQQRAYLPS